MGNSFSFVHFQLEWKINIQCLLAFFSYSNSDLYCNQMSLRQIYTTKKSRKTQKSTIWVVDIEKSSNIHFSNIKFSLKPTWTATWKNLSCLRMRFVLFADFIPFVDWRTYLVNLRFFFSLTRFLVLQNFLFGMYFVCMSPKPHSNCNTQTVPVFTFPSILVTPVTNCHRLNKKVLTTQHFL